MRLFQDIFVFYCSLLLSFSRSNASNSKIWPIDLWECSFFGIRQSTKVCICFPTLWVAAKLNPQISPQRVLGMFYPIFCFQQTFWLNIRQSMSPLNNIYIFRRIFLRQKLKNRVKIKKSVKIKNWQTKFFGFFFIFFGSNDKK